MAHRQLAKQRPGQTLNTTGLLHEAYVKLAEHTQLELEDRHHFNAVSAIAMRQIIIDHARRRSSKKRGAGDRGRVLQDLDAIAMDSQADTLLDLESALVKLITLDERLVRVVELRFFAGFSVEESAAALGCSVPTVKRGTRIARAFILRELDSDDRTVARNATRATPSPSDEPVDGR